MGDIEWEIYYWPAKNRGNHLALLFEEANVPYKLINDPTKVVQYIRSNRMDKLMNSKERKSKLDNESIYYQPMAPPYLIHYPKQSNEKIILCQTEHCVGYIAEKTGLKPDLIEDHYRAQMIVAHTNELQREMRKLRITATSKQEVIEFINGRFEIWMSILEKPLTMYKGQTFYFGNKISQADLCVFNVLNGIYEVFEERGFDTVVKSKHPILVKHYERILNRERVKRLMDKQKKENISWFPSKFLGLVWDWKLIKGVINDINISSNISKL